MRPEDVLLAQRLLCLLEERETFGPAPRPMWRTVAVVGVVALIGACAFLV